MRVTAIDGGCFVAGICDALGIYGFLILIITTVVPTIKITTTSLGTAESDKPAV